MLFNSFTFIIFFILIYGYYQLVLTRKRLRNIFLLMASYIFYMTWRIEYSILLMFTTGFDFYCGIIMDRYRHTRNLKLGIVMGSLVVNLGVLFTFKYWVFCGNTVTSLGAWLNMPLRWPVLDVLLPIGISFYTFQSLSYTIDVYRNKIPAERSLVDFALYVSFFPQLVAGPIERSSSLIPQLKREVITLEAENVLLGLKMMMFGFFKKMVVADNLAVFVDRIYNPGSTYDGFTYLLGTYCFAFQIYADFSGYSEIAIGLALMMGFRFMTNFNKPYFATTITEFWNKWHISLSSWLKDYLYISLGGNRNGRLMTYRNLFITMILGGLWHGANWTFVVWGFFNGLFLSLSKMTLDRRNRVVAALRIPAPVVHMTRMFMTFHLVCFTWIYFRASTITQAHAIIKTIAASLVSGTLFEVIAANPLSRLGYPVIGIGSALLMIGIDVGLRHNNEREVLNRIPRLVRYGAYCLLIYSILLFGVFDQTQFIYFQF